MTKDEAENCLRKIANEGYVQPSKHCREMMIERHVNIDDILNVLMWGKVATIEYNEKHDSWQCRVEGKDIEGESLVFIAAIYEYCHTVRCVTVF
ncbi:MAG: DUF4258 domain-containing protein [Desulfobacula sp.]|jgi:hypothetical protein|uniref:DUF4258 domain-containing protein n=1 Tax=Desulfobacula sp. TaxID=2593537 RepID=UPI001E042CCA|nr:DUF4258 domain-containing protein [Desulfobacula sp.]MBT3486396.1 DUF4258 domain-containing protein [Desulfobacula sp.]MBT3805372.1 DUF4258 domain-containing protein [Desulfobacula sp.]MBT4024526.1 DUF4258 domain-containing protein [Desulfobacula sp.]MBT4199842.1 DUF4258 domain-containing protein [Desulfobacula sp.]